MSEVKLTLDCLILQRMVKLTLDCLIVQRMVGVSDSSLNTVSHITLGSLLLMGFVLALRH